MSFLQLHIDQHKAETPMRILALSDLSVPLSQFPNIFVTLDGGGILYAPKITRQISLAKGQEINKCSTDSSASQKEHFVFPLQFLFARLSRVKRTFFLSKEPYKDLDFKWDF
jgi:hypothetical protein